jgi:protein-disulfide isomerase
VLKSLFFLLGAAALLLAGACGDDDDGVGDDDDDPAAECEPADDDSEGVCGPAGGAADDDAEEEATIVDVTPAEGDIFEGVQQDGVTLGSPDAGVEVLIFENFLCPHCREFTFDVFPGIVEDYVAVNAVRFVFKHAALGGGDAVTAHSAAQCAAEQGMFWPYAELLFRNQESLESGDVEGVTRSLASEAGLDLESFDGCLAGGDAAAVVEADVAEFETVPEESQALPLLVINGENLPAPTDTDLRAALDAAVSAASE